MAQAPPVPTTPLELLTPRNDRIEPFLTTYYGPIAGSVFGFTAIVFVNFVIRRPIFSGIHRHVMFTAGSGIVCTYLQKVRENYYAEKDAVLRHYLTLHPDDFKLPERKKFSEVLLPWVPIR